MRFYHELHPTEDRSATWQEALGHIAAVADAFRAWGLKKGDRVACRTVNGYPMLLWEATALCSGVVSVPLYAGLDDARTRDLLRKVEPKALLGEGAARLLRGLPGGTRPVEPARLEAMCAAPGDAAALERAVRGVLPGDIALLQFTSGTTGRFKGVLLTHRNLCSQQRAYELVWEVPPGSRFLSHLPWHHSYGGASERLTALCRGAKIFLEPSGGRDPERLLAAWGRVRPTHFCSVPKVFVRLMNRLKGDRAAERAFFHRDLNMLFTAGAPLPAECTRYFMSRGARIMEGWGLTETSPTVTMTDPGERRIHSVVGRPIPGVRVRVAPDGEILVKGPNVMKGYYRERALTRAAFDSRGWFRTGDLGAVMPEGLRILCRRDGVLKLLNGEKVASMPIEEALALSSLRIQHAVAVGHGRGFVAVLLFPDPELLPALRQGGVKAFAGLERGLLAALAPFRNTYGEVRAAAVIPRELSVSDGELTPTLKVVRNAVIERCGEWLEAIYREGSRPRLERFILRLG
jgi:long-subunit acyl-CoA synthetase (AMP-forming)